MIEQKSLVELAGDEIKKLISSGALSAGDRILEQHLSVQLGISRPPLREALRILAAQHILEQSPRRGYHVAGLGDDDAAEIYSLRTVLESFALDLLFERLDRVDFTELEVAVDAMWAAARAGDQVAVIEANKEFHLILVGLSGHNEAEIALGGRFRTSVRRSTRRSRRCGGWNPPGSSPPPPTD